MKTYPVPVRPIPHDDESPASLLIRTAEANGHASVFQLLSQIRAVSSQESLIAHWADPKRYRQLVRALGLGEHAANLTWLRAGPTARSPRLFRALPVAESLFTLDGTRFCPLCLGESPYWRRQWSISLFAGCITHRCLLLDRCTACGKTLSPGRGCLRRCNHCHAPLTTMKAPRIKPFPLFVLESLFEQNNATAVGCLLSFWEALSQFDGRGDAPHVAFDRLAMITAWYSDSPAVANQLADQLAQDKTTHPRIRMLPFLTAEPAIAELAELVLNRVPCSEWQYTSGRPIAGALSKREVCAVLRVSAAELATLIRTGALPWPAEGGRQPKIPLGQIEAYLDRQRVPDAQRDVRSDQSEPVAEVGWLDVIMLGARWQVHPEVIRSLIAAKWLPGRNRTVNRCRKMMVSLDDANTFEQQFAPVGTLAREWGVNATNLAEKLKSLGIKAIGGPGIDRVLTSLFKRADVAGVNAEMLSGIAQYPTRTGRKRKADHQRKAQPEGIATAEVAELLGISTQQVAVLLRRGVLKRTAQIYRPTRVDRDSYRKLACTLQRDDLLSIDAAAELLGVGVPRFRSNWVITEIIKVIDLGIWRFVTRDDVETVRQFRGRYFTATEAGRALGMHRTHMLNLEKQGLVQPLRFGKYKQLRLYERDAIRELVRQQRAAPDSWTEEAARGETILPVQRRHDWLPLPGEEAAKGGPPRLTWESFWEGKLEGWDEAEAVMRDTEVKRATKPTGS
ncbi:TniQ family protein [Chitinimonas sp. PSY-7]|uniref:TniQ family protein n=1 Tax=Chitinimonas sp. PSY-7 TaxID=3459088 RepID=UPI0040401573